MTGSRAPASLRLSELLAGVVPVASSEDPLITGLHVDSREVRPGGIFFALQGTRGHGLDHAAQALEAGAAAILWEPAPLYSELPPPLRRQAAGVPAIVLKGLREKIGVLADRFYGFPSREMHVIGVTGTDGKTSCSHFIAASLHQRAGRCGLIGTLGYGLFGALHPPTHTTPDAIRVHGLLADLRDQGARHVAMEVSSHALDQYRVSGVRFDTAVLTNLSRDHLDYHGDLQAYADAKRRLFLMPELRHAVLNLDDAFGRELLTDVAGDVEVVGYTLSAESAAPGLDVVRGDGLELDESGLRMQVSSPWGEARIRSPLLGAFNASNLLAVLATLVLSGMPFEQACAALGELQTVPGRVERFGGGANQPLVVVDYAHTPKALESVLQAVRAHSRGAVWCVFGCGGERDRGKRPLMAAAAERYADRVVVTDDNPRAEDPDQIVTEILAGFAAPAGVQVMRDRAQAIAYAIAQAQPHDVVLVAGKGHEDYQEIAGTRWPFSDREQVRRQLEPNL